MKHFTFAVLRLQYAGIFLLVVLFFSCNKEEPVPSYIHIDKFTLTTNNSIQGSNSHKIIDAWMYIDDQLVGTYEMPCTIPVLYKGIHTVKILPGVMENGISETRIPYPFYDRYEQTVLLTPGTVSFLHPATTYSQNAGFTWIEDFNGIATGICNNGGTHDSIMQITNVPAEIFEGGSGRVVLNSNQTSYLGISCDKFTLPQAGAAVFLELNYNCNTDFNIGLIGYNGASIEYQGISLSLRPTSGWNKVYVNLSNEVTGAVTSTKFAVFFSMLKNPDLSASYFYLDNVKLIN